MTSASSIPLLFKYESKQHSYPNQGLRFVASPEITSKLYTLPIEENVDLVPPNGSLEKASLFYLLLSSSNLLTTNNISFCSNCREIEGKITFIPDNGEKSINSWDGDNNEESEMNDERQFDEHESCFFCSNFSPASIVAYSCFAFATSANAAFTPKPIPEAYLVSVVVSKDFRKRGICSDLLKKSFVDLMENYGSNNKDIFVQRIRLHVRSDLKFLKEMYVKFGFVVRRNCPRYYPTLNIDAVEMLMENFNKRNFVKAEVEIAGMRRQREE